MDNMNRRGARRPIPETDWEQHLTTDITAPNLPGYQSNNNYAEYNSYPGVPPTQRTHGFDDFVQTRPQEMYQVPPMNAPEPGTMIEYHPMPDIAYTPLYQTTIGNGFTHPVTEDNTANQELQEAGFETPAVDEEPPNTPATRARGKRKERGNWTPQQDKYLYDNYKNGVKYDQIAEKMGAKFPNMGPITNNRLTKRVGRIGKAKPQALDRLPKAVNKIMPKFIALVEDELKTFKYSDRSGLDEGLTRELMSELPQLVPAFVQTRLARKRQSRQNHTSFEGDEDD